MPPELNEVDIDHKVARSHGGTANADNLQWVHKEVNMAKHALTEEQFRRLIWDCYKNLLEE